ncbi:uncharacterized protein LOC134246519, partial [Saccostrea cucullata]
MEHRRCEVKAFRKETWTHLIDMLNLRDEITNFDEMYEKEQADDDRSRKKEDELLNQDLEHIFCHHVYDCMFYMGLKDVHSSSQETSDISHLVYRVNRDQAEKMQYKEHFGKNLTENLEKTYDGKSMLVKIYTSRSPSPADKNKLLKFLKEKRLAEATIYIANIYGIRRNSYKTEPHYEDVSEETSTKNSDGLRELMDHRR